MTEMIRVEHLSKKYRLGEINSGTLSQDITEWFRSVRGQSGDAGLTASSRKEIWSLKDVSFTVSQGEVFGIVGRNGAGKSTLLKLLSKITVPSSGRICLNGRMASLLEVGTGFHPDLSGRENIFLNGALLGMSKQEIKARFDEIVDFSGVERFLDTPVKRYSSGMFVRLAFAVAAHLEPDILIIDEVLAVGDHDFQQKCMGKMQDVAANKGRTILFVSHNNAAIKKLCNKAMLLESGSVSIIGKTDAVLDAYQMQTSDAEHGMRGVVKPGITAFFTQWRVQETQGKNNFKIPSGKPVVIEVFLQTEEHLQSADFHFLIKDNAGSHLLYGRRSDEGSAPLQLGKGVHHFILRFSLPVMAGEYSIDFGLTNKNSLIDHWESSTRLEVLDDFSRDHQGIRGLLNIKTSIICSTAESVIID